MRGPIDTFHHRRSASNVDRVLRVVLCLILWQQLLFSAPICSAGPPLNVVLILCDDGGYNEIHLNDTGLNSNPVFPVPRLYQLARESVQFSQAYVMSPVCSPSRAGLMSGQYQQRFGYDANTTSLTVESLQGFPADQVMMSERMKDE